MGVKSANNSKYLSQEQYEVNGLLFPSKRVYENIKSIDRSIKLFYTFCKCHYELTYKEKYCLCFVIDCQCGCENEDKDCICEDIFDSPIRNESEKFNNIADKIEGLIDGIKSDRSTNSFLYKGSISNFIDNFPCINNCIIELMTMNLKTENRAEQRIMKIGKRMIKIGIELYQF